MMWCAKMGKYCTLNTLILNFLTFPPALVVLGICCCCYIWSLLLLCAGYPWFFFVWFFYKYTKAKQVSREMETWVHITQQTPFSHRSNQNCPQCLGSASAWTSIVTAGWSLARWKQPRCISWFVSTQADDQFLLCTSSIASVYNQCSVCTLDIQVFSWKVWCWAAFVVLVTFAHVLTYTVAYKEFKCLSIYFICFMVYLRCTLVVLVNATGCSRTWKANCKMQSQV